MNGSGTTMLLDHLSSHSQLFGLPFESRILPYFIKREASYGNLADDRNFLKLWREMARSIVHESRSGVHIDLLSSHWRDSMRTAAGAFDQILLTYAMEAGKRTWCEKTPMYVRHLSLLGKAFPNSKFIHVIRDGRDCAASFHRRWKFNPIRTVARWKDSVREGRAQGQSLGSRYIEVRYEEVTRSPEAAFRSILEFLGVPFEESVLIAARSRPEVDGSRAQGVVSRNTRSAADYFDSVTASRMERVAGRYLTELGYACRNPTGDQNPPNWQLHWWHFIDDLRRFRAVALTRGRILKPGKWHYVVRRIRGALKQNTSFRL
jgi:hypothetical protein